MPSHPAHPAAASRVTMLEAHLGHVLFDHADIPHILNRALRSYQAPPLHDVQERSAQEPAIRSYRHRTEDGLPGAMAVAPHTHPRTLHGSDRCRHRAGSPGSAVSGGGRGGRGIPTSVWTPVLPHPDHRRTPDPLGETVLQPAPIPAQERQPPRRRESSGPDPGRRGRCRTARIFPNSGSLRSSDENGRKPSARSRLNARTVCAPMS